MIAQSSIIPCKGTTTYQNKIKLCSKPVAITIFILKRLTCGVKERHRPCAEQMSTKTSSHTHTHTHTHAHTHTYTHTHTHTHTLSKTDQQWLTCGVKERHDHALSKWAQRPVHMRTYTHTHTHTHSPKQTSSDLHVVLRKDMTVHWANEHKDQFTYVHTHTHAHNLQNRPAVTYMWHQRQSEAPFGCSICGRNCSHSDGSSARHTGTIIITTTTIIIIIIKLTTQSSSSSSSQSK